MDKIKVSVIVPVYNPGSGFKKCLKSLQDQTLKETEIIFIDDCGTDESMSIAREAAQKDRRLRLLSNAKNMGAGPSRNRGIDAAEGEYLAFVDPDDFIAEDFLELLYEKGQQNHADIIKGEVIKVKENGARIENKNYPTLNARIRKGMEEGRQLCFLFLHSHWTALYRRGWVTETGARYGSSSNAEDTTFQLRVCYGSPRIEFVDQALYYYVERQGSADSTFTGSAMRGHIVSIKEKLEFLQSHFDDDNEMYSYLIFTLHRMLKTQASCALTPGLKDAADDFLKELRTCFLSSPFAEKLGNKDRTIDVFLKYGFNIYTDPFGSEWNRAFFKDYLFAVTRTVDFICAYPELGRKYNNYLWETFEQAVRHRYIDSRTPVKRRDARRALLREADRLPDRRLLTDRFFAMRMYIDHGIDLFFLRSTRAGKMIKALLRTYRSIRNKNDLKHQPDGRK